MEEEEMVGRREGEWVREGERGLGLGDLFDRRKG
jgi:hypothetical protein